MSENSENSHSEMPPIVPEKTYSPDEVRAEKKRASETLDNITKEYEDLIKELLNQPPSAENNEKIINAKRGLKNMLYKFKYLE